jgi:hypothetical protein
MRSCQRTDRYAFAMTIGTPTETLSGAADRALRPAELVALGLLVVEGLVILGYVAAGIANQAQYGGQSFSVQGAHAWGFTLSYVSGWASPGAVAVFLLAPLALVAWIGRRVGDEVSEARTVLVLRLELVLAVLTVAAGILSIVGRVMQVSPSQEWSAFFATLGTGVGSVCLGLLGVAAVWWLAGNLQVDVLGRHDVGDPADDEVDR